MIINNSLEQGLLLSMQYAGYSIDEVNMLNLSPDEAKRQIAKIMKSLYFDHDDREIAEKHLKMKHNFFQHIYSVTDCPFEIATKVCWDEMFYKANSIKEENYISKLLHPFFHIAVSSADFQKDILYGNRNSSSPRFEMLYYFSGKEMVEIGGVRYTFGEALMRMRCLNISESSDLLAISHPMFVIDEKLIQVFMEQPEKETVFRLLYTLYHLSSHDGMLHSLFKDSSVKIQDLLAQDPVGSRFLGIYDDQCLIYEINYLRLMREMFEIACIQNHQLKESTVELYYTICKITERWPNILAKYIRFIAFNRVIRLVNVPPINSPVFTEIFSPTADNSKVLPTNWFQMRRFIHYAPEKEALLLDGGPPISYEVMAKTMLKIYQKK